MGLFDFFDMADNYDNRKIARFEDKKKGIVISTCEVTDSDQLYETAVCHPEFRDGDLIVVEMYDTKEEAFKGHIKWMEIMKNPPNELKDVSSAFVSRLLDASSERDNWRIFRRQKK